MKTKRASASQIIAIHMALTEALNPKGNDGDSSVTYKNGYTDASVAEKVGCPTASVAKVRNEMFGPVRSTKAGALESRIEVLEAQLHEIRVKYHKLVTYMALNKMGDVRHLNIADMDKKITSGGA